MRLLRDLPKPSYDAFIGALLHFKDGTLKPHPLMPIGVISSGGSKHTVADPDGTKLVFEHEGRNFYGCARPKLLPYNGTYAFIIDMTGTGYVPYKTTVTASLKAGLAPEVLADLQKSAELIADPHISITWKDMQVEWGISAQFWKKLLTILPEGDIMVSCQGGKGRTGTALCALYMAANKVTAEEAIKHVRKEHHVGAVETKDQEKYLKLLEPGFGIGN
jgi:hypothetical protein